MNNLVYQGSWSFPVKKEFILSPGLSVGAKATYMALKSYCAPDGETAFPSMETLSYALDVSKDTVRVYVGELRDSGLLCVEQHRTPKDSETPNRFARNVYTLKEEMAVQAKPRIGKMPTREIPESGKSSANSTVPATSSNEKPVGNEKPIEAMAAEPPALASNTPPAGPEQQPDATPQPMVDTVVVSLPDGYGEDADCFQLQQVPEPAAQEDCGWQEGDPIPPKPDDDRPQWMIDLERRNEEADRRRAEDDARYEARQRQLATLDTAKRKQDESPPKTVREFTDGWLAVYQDVMGSHYSMTTADGVNAASFVKRNQDSKARVFHVLREALKHPQGFHSKQAWTMKGFACAYDSIRVEVQTEAYNGKAKRYPDGRLITKRYNPNI